MIKDTGLSDVAISKIIAILRKNPKILGATLYGSRAMGNYRNGSDIDLTLHAPDLSLSELLKIENEMDDLLLPYQIDLSLFHQIENQDLVNHIERVGREFYKKTLKNPDPIS